MMKTFIFSLLCFLTNPTERSTEEYILQTVLEAPELTEHFSYLPRYQRTGEFYYFLLKNEQVDGNWNLLINNNNVAIFSLEEMKKMGKHFYMEIQSLQTDGNEAHIKLTHKYDRLYREEQKTLVIHAKLEKKKGYWTISEMQMSKVNY